MNFLTKAIKALNKINRNKFYRDYAKVLNNTKLSNWGGIKPSVKDLEPYDIYMLGKIEEIEENMPQPVKQVQSDWNQNDENAPDYIKNRICSEEINRIFEDTEFKFNESGALNLVIESNTQIIFPSDTLIFKSLDPTIVIENAGQQIQPDGKSGSGGFAMYQGGGSWSFSYSEDTQIYTYTFNGSGNPSVVSGLEFQVYAQSIKTLDNRFIPFAISSGSGIKSIKESDSLYANGSSSHAEGASTQANGDCSHAEGASTQANGSSSHAEGQSTNANGDFSHAEGIGSIAFGDSSSARGANTFAYGRYSIAEGNSSVNNLWRNLTGLSFVDTTHLRKTGDYSTLNHKIFSFGDYIYRFVESVFFNSNSNYTEFTLDKALTEEDFKSSCSYRSEGISYGDGSHSEGYATSAFGSYSHTEGMGTIATYRSSHVFGEYNAEDPASIGGSFETSRGTYVEIVGKGLDFNNRSNARTLDWSGNEQLAGTLRIGSTSTGGALLKYESGSLKVSFDDGSTWKTVTLT